MRSVCLCVFLLVPATVLGVSSPAAGQAVASAFTLQGSVVDSTGRPVEGARVTAAASGIAPSTMVTDSRGLFSLALASARYVVTVSANGFEDASQRVTATAAGTASARFVLQVQQVRENLTVTAPSGYAVPATSTATKTPTALRDVPQAVTMVTKELIQDQMMTSVGDVMRYVPGVSVHQGENNRDQVIVRGNSSSADFFVDGVRDDVQYYRDLYNLERVEALKGPNAMIFGRGGGGGVVNRVSKQADFRSSGSFALQGGMFGNKRIVGDLNQKVSDRLAIRMDAMLEDSGSFRDFVGLTRYGVTPTLTFTPGNRTRLVLRYEYLNDSRTADRGISSFRGVALDVDRGTFFGNPNLSDVAASVHIGSAVVEHQARRVTLRNHTTMANYDRSYQNFVPGAVNAAGTHVAITSYNNATDRTNLFNQTDATMQVATGRLRHTILAGAEVGRQITDNFRNTGFFNDVATSVLAPVSSPTIFTPVTYRQNATDADNHLTATVAALYAQDQMALSKHVEVLAGLRFDRFDLTYHNNRTGETLDRPDNLVSPRAGVVYKPFAPVSLYGSYSMSYLPSSGDQFSSLTTITEQVKPEQFRNYEAGVKWDVLPGLSFTTALYRLDRTNTRATDPNDPTRIVQTGSQRTNGFELGATGRITPRWNIAGGYAYQDAFVTSATTAASAGAQAAQVPHHALSLWNNYQVHRRVGLGLGILSRTAMFAAIDNTVRLKGYTRVDSAAFIGLTGQLRLQVNVENLLDETYYLNADSNTNISFGFPRTVRVGLTAGF